MKQASKARRKVGVSVWVPIPGLVLTSAHVSIWAVVQLLCAWCDALDPRDVEHIRLSDVESQGFAALIARGGFWDENMFSVVLPDNACVYRSTLVVLIQAACRHGINEGVITRERFERLQVLMHLLARGDVLGARCIHVSLAPGGCVPCPPCDSQLSY